MAVKLKAFTLFESIIAMLIIVSVFAMATYSIVNITSSDDSFKRTKVLFELNKMAVEMKEKKQYLDGEDVIEGIHYIRKAEKYKDADNLVLLNFSAKTESGVLLYERKELIIM